MLLITVTFIALGWVGFGLWYAKDRLISTRGYEVGSTPYSYTTPQAQSPFPGLADVKSTLAAPRTEQMAHTRRQQVLVGLVALVVLLFLMTRLWTWMWVLQIAADVALTAFVVGLYQRSR